MYIRSHIYRRISTLFYTPTASGRALEADAAVRAELRLEAGDLAGSELGHARVVRVVHEVVDGVNPAARARVLARRAAVRLLALRRGVRDRVAAAAAAALEGVVQPEPVADLVGCSLKYVRS